MNTGCSQQFVEGAFCCYLCHKMFNYEIKTTKGNLMELHNNAHIARFFNDIFSQDLVRTAFYNYHRSVMIMATFQKMEVPLMKERGGTPGGGADRHEGSRFVAGPATRARAGHV